MTITSTPSASATRHAPVEEREHDHRPDEIDAGRGDPPDRRVDQCAHIASGRRYTLAKRARQVFGKIAHRLVAQIVEQVEPDIDPRVDGQIAAEPTADAPEHG